MKKLLALSTYQMNPMALAFVSLCAGIVCFSTGNVITKFADVGTTASAFYRLFLAMPMMWMWLQFMTPTRSAETKQVNTDASFWKIAPYGIACGVFVGGEVALLHYAYHEIGVAVTIFINSFTPLFVVLGSWAIFGNRPNRKSALALMVAAPGVFFLAEIDSVSELARLDKGTIAAFLSAVFFAGFLLAGTRMRELCNARTVINWTNFTACLFLAPIAIFTGEQLLPASWEGWAVLLMLAFISQTLGMNLYTWAMGTLSSTVSSFMSLSQPVLTLVLAWIVLGEELSSIQMAGAMLVLSAVAINNIRFRKRP